MHTCANLRNLVRRLHVTHSLFSKASATLCTWIGLLPENSMQFLKTRKLHFKDDDNTILPLIRFPAHHTASISSVSRFPEDGQAE